MANDALETVALRNNFYRDSYRRVVLALLFAMGIIVILAGGIIYLVTHPPQPKYFATTIDGRIQPLIALDKPNLSQAAVLQWTQQAAIAAYTYNFVNYRQELQAASAFFTTRGWQSFMKALEASNNLSTVLQKKLVLTAVATGAPVILQKGILNGIYSWRIQLPMLVTYQSASQISQQNFTATILVVRISTLNNPKGIGIAEFNA